ncbi:hypothetical protein ACBQ21_28010 [Pseudomonas putida]|uniref:hypothetical protein n=1 Tax=Pseudomonas putida TaxID=303 RepID=UPI0035240E3F
MVTQNHVTPFITRGARAAHDELVSALGTENNPRQWMVFMQAVTRLLPDVLSSGRPSRDVINRSPIGQLGFTSWQAMIEAPATANGLGWNFSAWKAWRRAWSTVENHPWLMYTGHGYTSSEVNTMALEAKRDGVDFPANALELDERLSGRQAAKDARKAESIQGLTQRAEAAEAALAIANSDLQTIRVQANLSADRERELLDQVKAGTERERALIEEIAGLKARLAGIEHDQDEAKKLSEQIGTLKAEVLTLTTERDAWKKKAKAKSEAPAKPGLWARLVGLFRRRE